MVVKEERNRYLVVEFLGEALQIGKFVSRLRAEIQRLGGDTILAKSALSVSDYSDKNCIVKCSHLTRDYIEAALQIISNRGLLCNVTLVSGTISGVKQLTKTP